MANKTSLGISQKVIGNSSPLSSGTSSKKPCRFRHIRFVKPFPVYPIARIRKSHIQLCLVSILFVACTSISARESGSSQSQEQLPYARSSAIVGAIFYWSTHEEHAPGSDNWPVTWADDGNQYTSWGDGGGFGGDNRDGRVSLGIARVEGNWHNYKGENVWGGKDSTNRAEFDGKSYGIISIDGTLYMWVSPGSNDTNYDEARLAISNDHGATWTKVGEWEFKESDALILPAFLQFGMDYDGARDDYVYSYGIRLKEASELQVQKPGEIDLMRVNKAHILDRSAYQFFAGFNDSGNPSWTSDIDARKPVFVDSNGVGWNVSVSYNRGLKRYLLATEHSASGQGNLGIFDAPEPWGPWTTVAYYYDWGGFGSTFFWNFANKWLSSNGKSFTIVFTGTGNNDSWNSVRGYFLTAVDNFT